MNVFAELYERCNSGTGREKLEALEDFPSIIDVEVTNACNFRCLFCPTGNKAMRRKTGVMDPSVFYRIVHECAAQIKKGRKVGIRFIGWGEPLMHPDILSFIRYTHDFGIYTHLNTNGSYFDIAGGVSSVDLLETHLDSIKFSFQGIDRKTYREARNTDFFSGLIDRLSHLKRVRDRRGLDTWIQVSTSTTDETEAQVEDFRMLFEPLCDQLSVGKTIFSFFNEGAVRLRTEAERQTFDRLKKASTKNIAHPDPCPEVYDKLSIAWDGSVRVCCNDYDGHTSLGKVGQQKISEMWRHPVIEEYRSRLADGEYTGPLCSVCYDYAGLTNVSATLERSGRERGSAGGEGPGPTEAAEKNSVL